MGVCCASPDPELSKGPTTMQVNLKCDIVSFNCKEDHTGKIKIQFKRAFDTEIIGEVEKQGTEWIVDKHKSACVQSVITFDEEKEGISRRYKPGTIVLLDEEKERNKKDEKDKTKPLGECRFDLSNYGSEFNINFPEFKDAILRLKLEE